MARNSSAFVSFGLALSVLLIASGKVSANTHLAGVRCADCKPASATVVRTNRAVRVVRPVRTVTKYRDVQQIRNVTRIRTVQRIYVVRVVAVIDRVISERTVRSAQVRTVRGPVRTAGVSKRTSMSAGRSTSVRNLSRAPLVKSRVVCPTNRCKPGTRSSGRGAMQGTHKSSVFLVGRTDQRARSCEAMPTFEARMRCLGW